MNRRYRTEFFRNLAYLAALLLAIFAYHSHAAKQEQYRLERDAIRNGHAVETGGETQVAFSF